MKRLREQSKRACHGFKVQHNPSIIEGKPPEHSAGIATLTGRQLRKRPRGRRPVVTQGILIRCISLIDAAAKIAIVILLKRFQSERDQRTRPYQSGFLPGRGCTDPMHNLRRTLEQHCSFCVRFRGQGLPMADNGGGRYAPQTLEAGQGVLLVDQDEG